MHKILQMTGKTKRFKHFVVYWFIDYLYNYFDFDLMYYQLLEKKTKAN